MASREEEKRRRREQRLAAEEADRRSQERARRMRGLVVGVGAVAIVAVAIAVVLGARGDDAGTPEDTAASADFVDAAAPAVEEEDLADAARAAGCKVREDAAFPAEHTTEPVEYETNPPTSGPHDPVPADDGAYPPGSAPPVSPKVHSLEHGRINIQWKPATSAERIGQLKSVFDEGGGYHVLLDQNQTGMPYAVAATAWTKALTCERITDETFDAIRAFRARYVDKGPEFVP